MKKGGSASLFIDHLDVNAALAATECRAEVFHLDVAPVLIWYLCVMSLFLLVRRGTRWCGFYRLSWRIVLIGALDELFFSRVVHLLVAPIVLEDLLGGLYGGLRSFDLRFALWPLASTLCI